MEVPEVASSGLVLRGVEKRFGPVVAVDGVDLEVPAGSLVGFLGPNGAGKTTTMRAIVGMVRLDAGSISWAGAPIDESMRRRIGYMPQERGLYARMRVGEQVEFFARLAGMSPGVARERTAYWIDRVDLSDRVDSLVQELSGGNQQRVQLAVALVHDPELLVLDEPFGGLDPIAAEVMRSIITERADAGAAVLFSSHQLDLVEGLCERVVVIADGRVRAAGDVDDLRAASPIRRLTVSFAEPPVGRLVVPGTVRTTSASRLVVDVPVDVPPREVLDALDDAPVASMSFAPPQLAEVFAELVAEEAVDETSRDAASTDGAST